MLLLLLKWLYNPRLGGNDLFDYRRSLRKSLRQPQRGHCFKSFIY